MTSSPCVSGPGSNPVPIPGARLVGPVDPQEAVEVTVRIRPRAPEPTAKEVEAMSALPAGERRYPSRESYAAAHGADPADVQKVEAFARDHKLEVKESSASRRSVVLTGTAQQMSAAFAVSLARYDTDAGSCRAAIGPAQVPAELAGIIEAVVGLDTRSHAKPHPGTT